MTILNVPDAVKRWEFIDVPVTANNGATIFKINDQPNLRMDSTQDIVIVGLEMFNSNAMPFSPISQNPCPTVAQLANTFLTLYVDQEESVHLVPAVKLNATRTALATATDYFANKPIAMKNLVSVNWDKSYFQVAQPYNTGGANAAFSIVLGVSYLKLAFGAWAKLTAGLTPGL